MTIDYTGPEGGGLAMAFAAGCTATWVFVRNLVMKPAIKSCHQRVSELEADRERLTARITQLETVLLTKGPADLREAMQLALSETRVDIDKAEGKI